MNETEIKFEREDRNGVVAVGTYLSDAAARLGVDLLNETESEQFGETYYFVVKILNGGELLSAPTKIETEFLSDARRADGERIASQAKIERAGEITIMTTKKKEEEQPEEVKSKEEYQKEFRDLPLEKKIASLLELEAIALGETVSFVLNSPYKIVDMAMGVLAEFGLKMETDAKNQKRPDEHKAETENAKQEEAATAESNGNSKAAHDDGDDKH